MRTPEGPKRVDVIYRRIDDDFLDPLAFNPESVLGIPGLFSVYRMGQRVAGERGRNGRRRRQVDLPLRPGDDSFLSREEPLLKNVPTYTCRHEEDRKYVLDHLDELVVKEVHGSGGYGMLVGPTSTADQIEAFRDRLTASPELFIAQPTLALSTSPTFVEQGVAPRHVDLRPFVLLGADCVRLVPGAFTRVALREGSLVVNSSQGGGTKDTWVLEDDRPC